MGGWFMLPIFCFVSQTPRSVPLFRSFLILVGSKSLHRGSYHETWTALTVFRSTSTSQRIYVMWTYMLRSSTVGSCATLNMACAMNVTFHYSHHAAALVRHLNVLHTSKEVIHHHAVLSDSITTHRCVCMGTILYNKDDAGVLTS